MRRLVNLSRNTVGALFVGALLMICSFNFLSQHSVKDQASTGSTSCSAACHSHAQGINATSFDFQEEDDDEEPFTAAHLSYAVGDLSLLYAVVACFAFWIAIDRRKIHLSTQLRI